MQWWLICTRGSGMNDARIDEARLGEGNANKISREEKLR
jgi:hypothetical protein